MNATGADDRLGKPPASSVRRRLLQVGGVSVALSIGMGIAVWLLFRWILNQGSQTFTTTAPVWAAAVTAVLTGLLTLVSTQFQAWANSDANERLAALNTDLATRLEAVRRDHAEELALLKGRLDTELDLAKARHAAERKSHDELLARAYAYYYTLSPLEAGRCSADSAEKADDSMIRACRYLPALETQHRMKWLAFWQEGRSILEEGRKIDALAPEGDGTQIQADWLKRRRRELWRSRVREFGGLLRDLEDATAIMHRGATPPPTTPPLES